ENLASGTRNQVFDFAQAILAEEDLAVDEKRRRSEGSALHRPLRVRDQLFLHFGSLNQFEDAIGRQSRFFKRGAQYRRIVELFRLGPHMPVHLIDVALEDAECLSRNRTAHYRKRVHREKWSWLVARNSMPLDEARGLQP